VSETEEIKFHFTQSNSHTHTNTHMQYIIYPGSIQAYEKNSCICFSSAAVNLWIV